MVTIFVNKALGQVIAAHVGDSRAIMVTESSSFDLTMDHKPSNPSEKERVELLGGRIIQYGVLRVQGILAVTSSLREQRAHRELLRDVGRRVLPRAGE